jgi:hypothetical protein
MPKSMAFLLLVALCLAGCGPTIWDKPGLTRQEFNSDNYACEKDARQSGYFGTGIAGAINMNNFYKQCMVAHGYTEVTSGAPAPAQPVSRPKDATFDASMRASNECHAQGLSNGSAPEAKAFMACYEPLFQRYRSSQ